MAAVTQFFYFDIRGKGEIVRLVLVAAGQKFEDNRISFAEWPEKKADTPYGQLPYIIYKGKKYAQSVAIANFFAREFGLYGRTNLDGLRIDEVVQLSEDLRPPFRAWRMEKDETKKAELAQKLKDETFAKFLGFFENLLIDNGVTLADLVVYDVLDTILGVDPEAIAAFPSVKKLRSNVEAVPAIKTYLASRPNSAI
nr:hypothetical protein BaRGS_029386 [Batillaria attramentaria]